MFSIRTMASCTLCLASALGAVWVAVCQPACVLAVETVGIGYEFKLSSHEGMIVTPSTPATAMLVAGQSQHELQLARNMPLIQLTNTSEMSSTEITTFTMTIGDTAHNFDWVHLLGASPGVGVAIHGVDGAENGERGDSFELELTNFRKDAYVRFQVDLDPDAAQAFPLCDFRNVLFDANGATAQDNALIEVTFHDPQAIADVALSSNLDDYQVNGPLVTGPGYYGFPMRDHVSVFPFGGEGHLTMGTAVPEPRTVALLAFGGLLLAGSARRTLPRIDRTSTNGHLRGREEENDGKERLCLTDLS